MGNKESMPLIPVFRIRNSVLIPHALRPLLTITIAILILMTLELAEMVLSNSLDNEVTQM